jgi:hypothetical protein
VRLLEAVLYVNKYFNAINFVMILMILENYTRDMASTSVDVN